jgi:hypothetical protein
MSHVLIADMADRAVEALLMRCRKKVIVDGLGDSTSFGSDVAAEVARRAMTERPSSPSGSTAMAYKGMARDVAFGVIDKLYDCKEIIVIDRHGEASYEAAVAAEVARLAEKGIGCERLLKEKDKVSFNYEYRFVAVGGLERKAKQGGFNNYQSGLAPIREWFPVEGKDFLSMTWEELEHVAHVIRDASKLREGD